MRQIRKYLTGVFKKRNHGISAEDRFLADLSKEKPCACSICIGKKEELNERLYKVVYLKEVHDGRGPATRRRILFSNELYYRVANRDEMDQILAEDFTELDVLEVFLVVPKEKLINRS